MSAARVPTAAAPKGLPQVRGGDIVISAGGRRRRVRSPAKNLAFDVARKVNALVARGDSFHVEATIVEGV
jgi:hypothetical protein